MVEFQDSDDNHGSNNSLVSPSSEAGEGCAVLEFDEKAPEETRQWLD
jgi:hypothetical protein